MGIITITRRRLTRAVFFASLIFSDTSAIAHKHHPTFIMMAQHCTTSTVQYRRSARLQTKFFAIRNASQLSEQYDSLKVSELRDLLRQSGLAVSGVKSVLIERLALATESPPTTNNDATIEDVGNLQPKAKRARKKSVSETPSPPAVDCLPRTLELALLSAHKDSNTNLVIIGVDEAGRGPLAGPVVAAAAIVPTNISGITDSKKITKESERERLYEEIIASPGIRYAVAVVSAQRIDEINILQATLEGMRMAVEGVMNIDNEKQDRNGKKMNAASAERKDLSYVITGGDIAGSNSVKNQPSSYHSLIDGNKVPKEMPCPCESLIKGDSREYSIGAASILAKVTRDRLMHEYDLKYPEFNLKQHKGYGTAAHMSAVRKYGASPIHRRTFAPLKHMEFDEEGKVIE